MSSDPAVISFDLVSNMTYMAAVATGGPPRDVILEWTIKQNYKTVVYFRQVYLLAKRAGFEYARAFQMVARKAKAETMKTLLLRFAGAISSGYPESDFLREEAKVQREQFINGYYRSLETMTKWGDAYAALLVSVSLVVVVAMITTMLSAIADLFVIALIMSMFMVTGFGVYIIYRTAPYEVKAYRSRNGPKTRWLALRLFYILVPIGVLLGIYYGFFYGMGATMVIIGLSLAPSGVLAYMDDRQLNKLDQDTPSFIRSLGNISAALGTTVAVALTKLDQRSMGNLEPHIKRLQTRLQGQIAPEKCWEAFRDEVGCELMNRTTHMFSDGIALGGAADKVGALAAEYATDAALMRARRNVSAAPFAYLTIPLHFAMTGLMVFILEIIKSFNAKIAEAIAEMEAQSGGTGLASLPDLPMFNVQDTGMLSILTMIALLSFTVANAFTPKFAMGGHPLNTCLFGAITCVMTGFNMLIVPPIAGGLLTA
jgi:flagellar protein FlaJ